MFIIGLIVYLIFIVIFLAGLGIVIYHLYRFGLAIERAKLNSITIVFVGVAALFVVISLGFFANVPWDLLNFGIIAL